MRTMRSYLSAVAIACIAIMSLSGSYAAGDEIAELKNICNGYEDQRMDAYDLAFFLAVHGYNVIPKGSYVELNQNGTVYWLVPNGKKSGLCDIL
jgi:hypothetical protein